MECTTDMTIWKRVMLAMLFTAAVAINSGDASAETADVGRSSITTQNTREQRDNGIGGRISADEHAPLTINGERNKSARSGSNEKTMLQSSQAPNIDFWFYSADVVLFNDHDNDGYYQGIDLLFDADTYFVSADVYAVVYLSYEGGPWNEYAATDNFTLFDTASDDEFTVVTELLSGYPTGSYDLLIELFDAYDDSLLAYFGPDDTSELAFLPLEDAEGDSVIVPEVIVVDRHGHGGGSFGGLFILALALAMLSHRVRRQNQ